MYNCLTHKSLGFSGSIALTASVANFIYIALAECLSQADITVCTCMLPNARVHRQSAKLSGNMHV